ncbi:hypothetical protein [Microbulbifer sediminum]|uniref:hypothetical protein n=1 Tax=Microbulbifer sediminum TaxID=2904250 RepID=UPI001F39BF49|nr:hypothetical protein [Microbulbifer sediminum]
MEQTGKIQSGELGWSEKGVRFTRQPIYRKFSFILLGVIIVSLLPHYAKIADPAESVSATFIIHAILYLGWYVLFTVQSNLSATGNTALHKKLGYSSLALFALLLFSGIEMLVGVMAGYDSSWDQAYLLYRSTFVWAILHTLLSFAVFYVLGMLYRRRLHTHKRFMLMASLSMISASVTRVAYLPVVPVDGMAVTLLSTYALLVTPMIMDRIIFNGVHPVLKWSVPVYVVTQIAFIAIIPATHWGQTLAFPL